MKLRFGKRSAKISGTRLALDVGTEYAKALVVSTEEAPILLGFGRARQVVGDMEDGAVARISGVVECCRTAIEQACSIAGHYPLEAVIGVAGEHVQGSITHRQIKRRRTNRPITAGEFAKMLQTVRQAAHRDAITTLESQTGLQSVDVELLNSTVLEVKIDGYRVRDPLHFKGTYVEISVFHTFSPLVHIGALQTIARELGLIMLRAVAEPYAVATGLSYTAPAHKEAIVVDIGGGSTDIALVRDGVVTDTTSIPIGGRSFTRSVAAEFSVGVEEAESIKLDYSARLVEGTVADTLAKLFQYDLAIWGDALRIGLSDVAKESRLPNTVYLCGGGAALPGIQDVLKTPAWSKGLFSQPPEIRLLGPDDVNPLSDPDLYLAGLGDVTPKSLGIQAALLRPDTGHLPGTDQLDA